MTQTPLLALDYLLPEQAQKHVTINDALRRLDGLVHLSVASRDDDAPPAEIANGARYLVGNQPTGAWAGQSGKLALYEDTAWHFFTPHAGWRLWDETQSALLVYDGDQWRPMVMGDRALSSPSDIIQAVSHDIDLSKNQSVRIPSHQIFLGMSALVLEEITGTESWKLGVGDGLDRFGTDLPVAQGSEIIGPADPSVIYWHDTPVLISPIEGRIGSGKVRLSLFSIRLPAPRLDQSIS